MTDPRSRVDHALHTLRALPAPPPSPALLAAVRRTGPAERRDHRVTLGAVAAAALVALALHVHSHGVRRDLAALPTWWFRATLGAWLVAFAAPLAIALLPRRRAMVIETRAARIAAIGVALLALALTTVLRIDAPPATKLLTDPAAIRAELEWCLVTGLEMIAAPLALAVAALRRVPLPIDRRWVGAALGAANGALAGAMLHLVCDVGGALHCGLAHGGQVVLGAALGSVVVPWFTGPPCA